MSESNFSFVANNIYIVDEMLKKLNLGTLNDLFKDIEDNLLLKNRPEDFPESHSELETLRRLTYLSRKNVDSTSADSYIGSGIYNHFVPAAVSEIANRAEFKTAYTPYAPELSQGLLTTLYEYQSMICELTGLEIANTSMYDWSTALAEAALMCMRVNRNIKSPVFLVSQSIHVERLNTLKTFAKPLGLTVKTIHFNKDGLVDINDLQSKLTEDTVGVYVENPNLFGLIELNIKEISDFVHSSNALFVVGIDPISLGVLKSPKRMGVDICVGEAHHLGNNPNFGGPALGILTSTNTKQNLRNMPGRIIGYTTTKTGDRDAYIMTLQTREQHIRREKATSNICTNESLFSVAAAAYLSILGPQGLESIGKEVLGKIDYVTSEIANKLSKIKIPYRGIYFKECYFIIPKNSYQKLKQFLLENNILIGPNINHSHSLSNDTDGFIFSVTENHSKDQLDRFIRHLEIFEKEVL